MNYFIVKDIQPYADILRASSIDDLQAGVNEVKIEIDNQYAFDNPTEYKYGNVESDFVHVDNITPPDSVLYQVNGKVEVDQRVNFRKVFTYGLTPKHANAYDVKGDQVQLPYYKNFNPATQEHSDLAVVESNTVYRDSDWGLPYQMDIEIKYYAKDGITVLSTYNYTKYFDQKMAIDYNIMTRKNILRAAKDYLWHDLVLEFGQLDGDTKAKSTLLKHELNMQVYSEGNTQPLLDAIDNDADAWMSTARKTQLDTILNIDYTQA